MATAWPSKDVARSLVAPINLSPGSKYADACFDSADLLWVARSLTNPDPTADDTQCEVAYSTRLYTAAANVVTKVDGPIPVWLRCPEGTIYLICGGKSYQLDSVHRTLLNDTVLTNLAALTWKWTWAWRGDELWIAKDLTELNGLGFSMTRDRGRTRTAQTPPTDRTQARHPRVVIAPTGEMVCFWWEEGDTHGMGDLFAAITRDYATWTELPKIKTMPEQTIGALYMNQKLVLSYVSTEGTVKLLECDSLNGTPTWR